MTRALIPLHTPDDRERAIRLVRSVPPGSRVEVKGPKRTLPQNDKFWAMLTDISRQLPWHGHMMAPTDWRSVFIDGLKREGRTVPSLDSNGMVELGRSSTDLSTEEMSDIFELLFAFGANHGIVWSDPNLRSLLEAAE